MSRIRIVCENCHLRAVRRNHDAAVSLWTDHASESGHEVTYTVIED
jgi:hypothetical protein